MDFDEVLVKHLGQFGKAQIILFCCLLGLKCLGPFNTFSIIFIAAVPDHWCATPELDGRNFTVDAIKNLTIPVEEKNGELRYSSCQMYDQNYTGWTDSDVEEALTGGEQFSWNITSCRNGMVYDTSLYSSSIVSKWDLVCEKAWLQATASSLYMAGFMVGVVSMGALSDLFGRKPIMWLCLILEIIVSVSVAFSPGIYVYLVQRFLVGAFTLAVGTTAFVLLMEAVGPSSRVTASVLSSYTWTVGYLLLALIAYFIRDWINLQLTLAIIPSISLILFCFIDESPRWLYAQNKNTKADIIVRKWGNLNKVELPDILDIHIKNKKKAYYWDMLKTPRLRLRSLILFYTWFVASFVYYGLTLNTSNLGGNPYVNFGISAAVEIPALMFAQVTLIYVGRRLPLVTVLIGGGVSLLCIVAVPNDLTWLIIVIANLGKFFTAALFKYIYIYTSELYPTIMRNTAIGGCSFFARIGGIIAPFVAQLGLINRQTPLIIFGAVSLLGGVLGLYLPETRGAYLPDTIEESENFGRSTPTCGIFRPLYHKMTKKLRNKDTSDTEYTGPKNEAIS